MKQMSETAFTAKSWGKIIDRERQNYYSRIIDLCVDASMSASTYIKVRGGIL